MKIKYKELKRTCKCLDCKKEMLEEEICKMQDKIKEKEKD